MGTLGGDSVGDRHEGFGALQQPVAQPEEDGELDPALPDVAGLAAGGVLAAWGYADFVAPEGMVEAVEDFRSRIDPYWPPEREQIDAVVGSLAEPGCDALVRPRVDQDGQ